MWNHRNTYQCVYGMDPWRDTFTSYRELRSGIRGAYDPGFVNGNTVSWNPVTQVALSGGDCRDDADMLNLIHVGSSTVTITTTGPGVLQTGSAEASDSWYVSISLVIPRESTL